MNGRRWWLVIALVLSVAANIGFFLGRGLRPAEPDAQRAPQTTTGVDAATDDSAPDMPPRYRRLIRRMASELKLDDERSAAFVTIHEDFFRQTRQGRAQIIRTQAALRAEILAATPDRQRAEGLVDELADAQAELERAFVATFFDTLTLLDAEQALRYRRILVHLRRIQTPRDGEPGARQRRPWRRGPFGAPPDDRPRPQNARPPGPPAAEAPASEAPATATEAPEEQR